MYIVYVQYSTVYIGKHNGDMGENKKLYTFFVKEGPLSVPGFYFMYNIWQDAGIRTRDSATAARCATIELQTSLSLSLSYSSFSLLSLPCSPLYLIDLSFLHCLLLISRYIFSLLLFLLLCSLPSKFLFSLVNKCNSNFIF